MTRRPNVIARFWDRYQSFGTAGETPPREVRYVRALNGVVLIVSLLLWSQLPFVVGLLPATRAILLSFLLWPLAWQLVPLLNHLGRHTEARLFFSLSSLALIAFNAVQLGRETENHLFMISAFVGAFLIYPPRQYRYLMLVAALSALGLLGLELFYRQYGSLVTFPAEFLSVARWSSMSSLFMILLAISVYHYRVVQKAEDELEREHRVSEGLLLNILPAPIAARLKAGQRPIADRIECASILFADIIDFTPLANRIPHERVVEILDTLFTRFDRISRRHGLEKIKTVGDEYMLAGGVPVPAEGHHAAMAECALEMLAWLESDPIPELPGLAVRIGIHTGPVVAGVICERKFAYDLWGDAVNTASRMQSHGLPNRVQVSAAFHDRTKDQFVYERRGVVSFKGKGEMEAYLLVGRRADVPVEAAPAVAAAQ